MKELFVIILAFCSLLASAQISITDMERIQADSLEADSVLKLRGFNLKVQDIGANLINSANPSSMRFLRSNADNTVAWLTALDFRNAIGVSAINPTSPYLPYNNNGVFSDSHLSVANNSLFFGAGTNKLWSNGTNSIALSSISAANTGEENTIFGWDAGKDITTGIRTTLFGWNSGRYLNETLGNTAFGYATLYGNLTGSTSNYNGAFGYKSLYSLTSGSFNVGLGDHDLTALVAGNSNTAIGSYVLYFGTAFSNNTAVGYQSLKDATGSQNTAIGTDAGIHITSGEGNFFGGYQSGAYANGLRNVYIGEQSGFAINGVSTGNYNVGIGYKTLYGITTGNYNVSLGFTSGTALTTGSDNIGIGYEANRYNVSATHNIAVGSNALRLATAGDNVGIGGDAMRHVTSGTQNIGIGRLASVADGTYSNTVVIGYNQNATKSNLAIFGNASITETWLRGNVGVGTTSPTTKLDVDGNARFRSVGTGTGLSVLGVTSDGTLTTNVPAGVDINSTEYKVPVNIGNSFADAPIQITTDTARVLIGSGGGLVAVYDTTYTPVFEEDSLGYMGIYANAGYSNTRRTMPVTMTEAGEIISITIYHTGAAGNFIVGVYSDSGNAPANRLGSSGAIAAKTTAGWQEFTLSTPVSVTNGQKVWLTWVSNISSTNIKYQSGTYSGRKADASFVYADGMPATFGASSLVWFDYSVYCNYQVEGTPIMTIDTTYTGSGGAIADNGLDALQVGGNANVSDTIKTGYLKLVNTVNEISTDGTLSGNSDSAIPTEKAVKTYVDNNAQQFNLTPITLSGSTPAWNTSNSVNAKITMSANTTITLSNASYGWSGQLTVTNSSTSYTLDVTGYSNTIGKAIGTTGNTTRLNTSGVNGAIDRFTWYYDGTKMNWSGELNVIK